MKALILNNMSLLQQRVAANPGIAVSVLKSYGIKAPANPKTLAFAIVKYKGQLLTDLNDAYENMSQFDVAGTMSQGQGIYDQYKTTGSVDWGSAINLGVGLLGTISKKKQNNNDSNEVGQVQQGTILFPTAPEKPAEKTQEKNNQIVYVVVFILIAILITVTIVKYAKK